MRLRTLLGAALASLAFAVTAAGAVESQCGVCHPEERVNYEGSIHLREEVTCVGCHGGDSSSRDEDIAHGGDFEALMDRREIPQLCGSCHSDLEQMRAYNLPVDQLAIYGTSPHGQGLALGDTTVAVCTDCHGTHDIRSPDDATSSTFPRNLPQTCEKCHGDEELMTSHSLNPNVVEDYRISVHGRALLEGGNLAAPTCVSCHGVHGAAPTGFGNIDRVCGTCHEETRRAFLAGPHHTFSAQEDLPECSSCHSNHLIEQYSISEFATLCRDCHDADSQQFLLGQKFQVMIEGGYEEIRKAEDLILSGQHAALDVEDHLGRIEEANTLMTEALSLVHSVSIEPMETVVRRARSIGEEVQHEIYIKLDHRMRHVGLAVFWFYILMTIVILLSLKRRIARGRES